MEPKFFFLITDLPMTILSLISFILVLSFYIIIGGYTNSEYLSLVAGNLNTGPIMSTSYGNTSCSKIESPLINDMWPGTDRGCFKNVRNLYRGFCPLFLDNTFEIEEISASNYEIWRGVRICAKRLNQNYFNLSIASELNSCPSDERSCGIIDSFNNVLCIKNGIECPYNYIQVVQKGQPMPSGFNYTTIPLSEGANMILSNQDTNGKIIVNFQISEDIPCADPKNKNYLYKPFILEKFYDKDKCYTKLPVTGLQIDPSFQLVDSYSYYKVYIENLIVEKMITLPLFDSYLQSLKTSQRTMKLYQRNYVGIKSECLSVLRDLNLTQFDINDFYSLNDISDKNSILFLSSMIINSITIFLYILFLNLIPLVEGFPNLKVRINRLIFYLIPSMLTVGLLIITCIIVANVYGINVNWYQLLKLNCFDSDLLQTIVTLNEFLNSLRIISIVTMILNILIIFICIIQTVCLFLPKPFLK